LLLPDAPFLRAIHVWGPSDRSWSRGDEAEIVAAGERAGIDHEFLARVEECVVPSDPAVIVYSSGSTADPKGAIHSHGAVVRHSCNVALGYPIARDDVMFTSMPPFWIGGLITGIFQVLHVGATLVTQSSFEPGTALDLIEQERATIVTGWPQQGKTLREHPTYMPARVATVVRTSMPDLVPPEHQPPAVSSTSLGMTEMCSVHTSWDQYDALPESKRGAFGKSLPGLSHKVVDPDTLEELPVGVDGELWARGYSLMQGLHRREREEVFEPDGWYRTGDAGHFDEDGWFYFTGRLGEMIKTPGGANVAPAEVEAALMAYTDVHEAYVTGIPAAGDGELVMGAVVPRGDATIDADELRARLKAELSAYKVPKQIWVCQKSELPFLQSGKIKKQELATMLSTMFGADA
jgi:acyl-CoA synthetase (AMP-forming)/AMP-acid ligase II